MASFRQVMRYGSCLVVALVSLGNKEAYIFAFFWSAHDRYWVLGLIWFKNFRELLLSVSTFRILRLLASLGMMRKRLAGCSFLVDQCSASKYLPVQDDCFTRTELSKHVWALRTIFRVLVEQFDLDLLDVFDILLLFLFNFLTSFLAYKLVITHCTYYFWRRFLESSLGRIDVCRPARCVCHNHLLRYVP